MYDNIRLVATKNATDSFGMMSRMKAQLGMRQSQSPSASGFIFQSKIKRAINEYSKSMCTIEKTISTDRMVTRLDRYSLEELKYLHQILQEDGVLKLFDAMRLSRRKLINQINELNARLGISKPEIDDDPVI